VAQKYKTYDKRLKHYQNGKKIQENFSESKRIFFLRQEIAPFAHNISLEKLEKAVVGPL
jgi:hypothetical protein